MTSTSPTATARMPRPGRRALPLLAAALLAGCSVAPRAIPEAEVRQRAQADLKAMYRDQEPVVAPISLEEAVARALKYNLDQRLKLMETALASGLAEVSRYDMLPSLMASAGYSRRSNDAGGTSVNIATGQVSLEPSTSQSRGHTTVGAEFSWNVLDFGLSYYRARQQADQVLVTEERRQRVVQNILQDVRSAYWRAVGAQRLTTQAEALQQRVQAALERSRTAEREGLLPPREALAYQRQLLDAVGALAARRNELAYARQELAALMNLPQGTPFTLVEASGPELRALPEDTAALEEMALASRPELREEDYRVRISRDEARRQVLALLPGLRLNAGYTRDSNTYLYNNGWFEGGVQVSLNLLKLLALPAVNQAAEAQRQVDDARRMALSMAVLTQVRVSVERYRIALHDLALARESATVDQRMASHMRATVHARADAELEQIRADVRALNAEYQRHAAYATAQNAFGRVYNSLGLGVLPEMPQDARLGELSYRIGTQLAELEKAHFPVVAVAPQALPGVHVRVAPAGSEADTSQVAVAVARALARNQIPTLADNAPGPVLHLNLVMQPARDGLRKAEWQLRLERADGSTAGEARYPSTLPAGVTPRTVAAFGEAASLAHLDHIEQWLR